MKPDKVVFFDEDLEKSFNELSDKDPIKKGSVNLKGDNTFYHQIFDNFP